MTKNTYRRQISLWTRLILPLALVVATLAVMTACGGGGSSSPSSTTQAAEPNATFSSTSLTFSSQQVGSSSAAQSVTLTNSGNATLMISGISITGADAGDFAQTNTCGSSVAASANCTISVTFKPTASGSRTASVSVADNATGSPQTVSLTGTGGGTSAGSGAISKAFFGMVPGFYTSFPYANLWPTVPLGTIDLIDTTQWGSIERKQGVYTWTDLDNAIQEAQSNGASIVYNVFGVPQFYTASGNACSDGCPGPPTDMQAFTNFITALVSRYKGQITYYEFWNEVNFPTRWTGTPAQFVSLVQSAYSIIKQIDPNAKVLAPSLGVSSNFASFLQDYLTEGGASVTDGISWHGFRCQSGAACLQGASCDSNALDCAGSPLVSFVKTIQAAEQAAGLANLPLYDTSGSWGENQFLPDLNDQVAYVARWYIIQASEGVAAAYWYGWGGDPSEGMAWGSIFDANTNQTTEAATAYTTTYNWLQGSTMNGPCSADANNVWTCALTFSNKNTGLIVWNGDETSSTYTPESKYIQYETLTSSSAASVAGKAVTIGESPILLESGSRP